VAGDREDRRAAQGHVAPSLAKGFLSLARNGADEPLGEHDAVTRAYFRDLASPSKQPKRGRAKAPAPTVARVDDSLLEILETAGVVVFAQSERLLTSPQSEGSLGESLLMRAMQSLQQADPKAFSGRSEELAYLTNVLVSGCSMRGRKMRPVEAIRAVMATCNLGLALSMPRGGKVGTSASLEKARTLLTTVPADGLFRLAWHRIHGDVVDQAANAAEVLLDRAMSQAPAEDKDVFARDLSAIRTHRSAGTPWEAMSALDCLAGAVEPAAIDSLAGLMDQCPTLPDEAPAASSKNGTARGEQPLRFISTLEELAAATRFLSWLEEAPAPSAAPAEPPRKPAKRKTARRK
ncbi:MAG: hypothetical protein MUF54_22110, partial [Polyangiaceae bacterium]|nr:hypothetical protein [Polyangiaceae bacterium]